MSMFHRRRGSAHIPKNHFSNQQPAANPAAASAASQAFLKSRNSNPTLSAAAAAAALRTHATGPTAVSQVQTKRMQRRASTGSGNNVPVGIGRGAPTLQRQNSSGSMTERTFRSPSPNRGSPARAPMNAPPVPALPKGVPLSPVTHRPRASSLDPQDRLRSPDPKSPHGRVVSLDTGGLSSLQNARLEQPRLQNIQEMSRESSRKSINFSRPISPQLGTLADPLNRPPKQTGWFTGPVQSGQPARGESKSQRQITSNPHVPKSHTQAPKPAQAGPSKQAQSSEADSGSGHSRPVTSPSTNRTQHASGLAASIWNSMTPEAKNLSRVVENQSAREGKDQPVSTEAPEGETRPRSIRLHVPDPSPITPAPIVATKQARPVSLESDKQMKRSESASPPRNARFANGLPSVVNGLRHEPPGRSASPVKSAIKHNRTTSARTSSPPGSLLGEVVDASDAESPKPKKSARVSFEEPKPGPSGLQASKYAPAKVPQHSRPPVEVNDNLDDIMGPRPALPSFGSIRGQNRGDDRQATSAGDERRESSQETMLAESMSSSDHAVGGILRQNLLAGKGTRRQDGAELFGPLPSSNDPLPPEVTSVEGTGYLSDSEDDFAPPEVITETPSKNKVDQKPEQSVSHNTPRGELAPQLTLQPPTPVAEVEKRLVIPGAFPDSSDLSVESSREHTEPHKAQLEPYSVRFADDQQESSSDGDSIYSDAEEELDNGGFASLDAVLQSSTKPEVSHTPKDEAPAIDEQAPDPHITDTSAHGKPLGDVEMNSKGQIPQADVDVKKVEDIAPQPVVADQSAIPKTLRLESTAAADPPAQTGLSTSKWTSLIKKTKAAAGVRRARSPPRPIQASSPVQPRSHTQLPSEARSTKQPIRSENKAPVPRPLQRSDSNESASSFQRRRATPRRQPGQPTMRHTMRSPNGQTPIPQGTTSPTTNASLRAQSPNGVAHHMRSSLRTFSGDSTSPSLLDQNQKRRALSPSRLTNMMRLKKSSRPRGSKASPVLGASRFQSRFANDSDDDEPPRRIFTSRFEDSDDELDVILPKVEAPTRPTALPPVRGIPRRAGEEDGDSTDLSDSESLLGVPPPIPLIPSVRDVNKAHVPSQTGSPVPGPGEVPTDLSSSRFAPNTASSPLAEKQTRRASFFSSLSGNSQNRTSRRFSSFGSTRPPPESRASYDVPRPQGKLRRKSHHNPSPTVSPQQTKEERIIAAGDSAPRWPLPTSPVTNGGRPKTADGVLSLGLGRPGYGRRRNTTENILDTGSETTAVAGVPPATSGGDEVERLKMAGEKKTRFGKLRRAFRMKE